MRRILRESSSVIAALGLGFCAACHSAKSSVAPARAQLRFLAQAQELPAREFPIDVERYSLELDLDPAARSLHGRERVRFVARRANLARVVFDLEGLKVEHVRDERGVELAFQQTATELAIELPRALKAGEARELAIEYGGKPERGLWFTAEQAGVATQVFTQGECEDARAWFACIDHPSERATSEIVVRMPRAWKAVCAGYRLSREEQGEQALERWRMDFPHPAYLETLCAGEFVEKQVVWDGIPLLYLAAPRLEPLLETSFAETESILSFLSQATGQRYPYPKYAQVCVANFPFGGMENVSATTLTETALVDEKGARDAPMSGLVAHEAAHQWFGDLVTCADWSQAWLNEGFATYFGALYLAESQGADDFGLALREMQDAHVAADRGATRRAVVWGRCIEPLDLFTGHVYGGAAVRLHLLRGVLGDAAFFRGIKNYLTENAGHAVHTKDLRLALERASGKELKRFFEQWFEAPGHPEFEIGWKYDAATKVLLVSVDQRQRVGDGTPECYETPAEIEIKNGSETQLERVEIKARKQLYSFACKTEPRWVRFDPHGWIPKALTATRSDAEWLDLAANAPEAASRREALQLLAERLKNGSTSLGRDVILSAIIARAGAETSSKVRASALEALAGASEEPARAALELAAEKDAEAPVRVAALNTLSALGEDAALAALAERAFEQGYSWGTMGAAAKLYAHADPAGAFERLERALATPSPEDVLASKVLAALGETGDERARALCLHIATDVERPVGLRGAAVSALARFGARDREVQSALAELVEDGSWRVRKSAIDALGQLGDARSLRALEARWPRASLAQERRAIEAAFEKPAAPVH